MATRPLPHDGDLALPATPAAEPPVASSSAKRALDVVGAAVALVLASPLLLLAAAAIRLDSRGGVLFRQQRVGKDGRRFAMLKLRTMYPGSDERPHREYVRGLVNGDAERPQPNGVFKLAGDARVTRVGRVLRRFSIDELPQLWNVLKGEMSLVGPRPPLPYEVELYDATQLRRLQCRPGLTGLWQVSGRNLLSYREMCELDLRYMREWSHALDAAILLRTIPVVLRNHGHAS